MADATLFWLKGLLLTEALAHAVRSWGIFDDARSRIAAHCDFLRRLLACYECSAVWIAASVFFYLYFLDFPPFDFIIIVARLATIGHIAVDYVDALRASAINKI